jgi:hypothetical protein
MRTESGAAKEIFSCGVPRPEGEKFMLKIICILLMSLGFCSFALGCYSKSNAYSWQEMTSRASFPEGYNYPVFVMNGKMYALHKGGWVSTDGKNWEKTGLPEIGLNSAYQRYIQFKNAVYALGAMEGNYLKMRLFSKISRTHDFKTWETVAEKSNLPARVFYGAAVFKDKIWLFGGYDGKNYYNDVWNSTDGVRWKRVAAKTDWTPRNVSPLFVFKNRLWFIGGGVIDGEKTDNPNSGKEVWSSADGVNWTQVETYSPRQLSGTPIVFDNKLWLIGGNRSDGNFANAVFVSEDGSRWQEQSAPWSPRGGVATWVFGNQLFITGGKFSYQRNGELVFVYSNDVWAMSKKTE